MGLLRAWRERRTLRQVFDKYMGGADHDRFAKVFASSSASVLTQLEPANLPFVLVQVRDDRPDQVAPRLSTVHEIVVEKQGTVCDIMSSMTMSVFGFPVSAGVEKDRANCAEAATELIRALAPDARLVHGMANGLMGNSGSPNRFHYGPVIPRFAGLLEVLMKLEFGEARELSI